MADRGRTIARWCCGVLAAVLSAPLSAAGFSVSPTRVEFTAGESVKGLRLHNSGERPIQAQLRVFAWTQTDGDDVLEPSTDLVVSPPMASIAPGTQQLVRIVRRNGAAGVTVERSYRLLVDELPSARLQQDSDTPAGLNFVIRYSVPLFIAADGAADGAEPAPAQLAWLSEGDDEGRPQLTAHNPSASHAQVSDLRVLDAQGRILHRHDGLLGYVLARATRRWPLDLPAQTLAGATVIEARINGEIRRQALSGTLPQRGAR